MKTSKYEKWNRDQFTSHFGSTMNQLFDHWITMPEEVATHIKGYGYDANGIMIQIHEDASDEIKERIQKELSTFSDEITFQFCGTAYLIAKKDEN